MSRYKATVSPLKSFDALSLSMIALDQIQDEIIEWQNRNFGEGPEVHPLLGMVEETGELLKALPEDPLAALGYFMGQLAHAVLKDEQGIRGTHEEHVAEARDAIGDWAVYAMAYCAKRGWKLSDIIEETWLHVQQRDWKKDPLRGAQEDHAWMKEALEGEGPGRDTIG